MRLKWHQSTEDCKRLSSQLTDAHEQINRLETKIQTVRRLFDDEVKKRKLVEEERNIYESQLDMARDILQDKRNKFHDEAKEKLNFLSDKRSDIRDRLDTITEMDLETTGSVMSDLSYTRDEDEFLNVSGPDTRGHKRQMPSKVHCAKRRRSGNAKTIEVNSNKKVIATTTVTMEHNGPVSATSVIETVPTHDDLAVTPTARGTGPASVVPSAPPANSDDDEDEEENMKRGDGDRGPFTPSAYPVQPFSMNTINTRPHIFVQKAMMRGEVCNVCSKRMRFSTLGAKCRDCKSVCHVQCKDKVPLPCIPAPNTPNSKNNGHGTIADYTPLTSPMVPSLIVHCIKEVESRGLTEVGIYRIPGSDKEVKGLKEKFLKGKGVPNLAQVPDIHVICGTLKEFLRSLKEPLITHIRWDEFARAANLSDPQDRKIALKRIINDLPQPNRDTLAYMMLHLQRVAKVPDCKMPASNLAKVFGPTLIGYSQTEPENVYAETNTGNKITSELLDLPSEFWQTFMRESEITHNENDMQKTPSSHSLRSFFPSSGRVKPVKKIKYFETP
ncbi:rac GTPase activating protein tumbleweed isoform X2 [Rhodnius prolixus]